jgi:hypothetical protein
VPTYLDFLVALDDYLRASVGGDVTTGYDMHVICRDAGLSEGPQSHAPYWTGQLVDRGYLTHSPPPPNGRSAPPRGAGWTDADLQSFNRYALTEVGLAAAERERQRRRAQATDAMLNPIALLSASWLTDEWRDSVRTQLTALRGALDREEWASAIGYAKNLVEAAALVVLDRRGHNGLDRRPSVSTLVREACDAAGLPDDLARRLASVVQVVGDLRNATDAGHGQAVRTEVLPAEARLASSSAVAIAAFLLADG